MERPKTESRLWERLPFASIYTRKIKNFKGVKVAKFNFKILSNILPCNKNLANCKLQDSDKCTFCNAIQTVEHMLYECNNSKSLWNIIELALWEQIGPNKIFPGDTNQDICLATSLISCIIYKYWLLVKDENTPKIWKWFINLVKTDLKSRITVYIFAGFTHGINVLLDVFKELYNVNLE